MGKPSGAEILCHTLASLGASHVFGLPGTQNIHLFEALRRSSLRTVVGTHELSCAFMANGYYRASGKPGILTTIPGPGLTFTLAALTEAAHDSAALLYLLLRPRSSRRKFDLQFIDQEAILKPVTKHTLSIEQASEISTTIRKAYALSLSDEPGPVVAHCSPEALLDCAEQDSESSPIVPDRGVPGNSVISEIAAALETSHSPVLFVGQGAGEAPDLVKKLAERIQAVVVSTRSGRGILPENHPRALVFDTSEQGRHSLQRLLDRSDLVLALGCKFTHNGSFGFKLRIPQEKLIHVDSSEAVLGANYPARTLVRADCAAFLGNLLATLKNGYTSKPRWTRTEIEEFRIQPRPNGDNTEPAIQGFSTPSTQTFFSQLRDALPPETCLVTDSGRHQVLATRYFQVLAPRGLLLPTDFQSMGFGLPAAIGAKLAAPERPVVAIIGDGGFAMCGLELATAVRENIPLTLIVFNDEALGQIRLQQLASFGEDYATNLRTPDLELFAESIGARYIRLRSDSMDSLRAAILSDAVTLVEVNVANRLSIQAVRMKGILRRKARGRLFQRARDFLKR